MYQICTLMLASLKTLIQEKLKIVPNRREFKITDSKWLKDKSKGAEFEFKITGNSE